MVKILLRYLLSCAFLFLTTANAVNAQKWSEMNALALGLFNKGKIDSAILTGETARQKAVEEFGKNHSNYVLALNNLGYYYEAAGKRLAAEPIYTEALKIARSAEGKMNSQLYNALNNLGLLSQSLRKFTEAEALLKEALVLQEKIGGKKTVQYGTATNNLAVFYNSQGNFDQAEPLYLTAAEIYKDLLGAEHAHYATVLDNLSNIYAKKGNYVKAEKYVLEALTIRKKILGTEHLDYAISLIRLANTYETTGRYAQAEPLYHEAIAIRKNMLGTGHPDYLIALNSLAHLLQLAGTPEKAIPLLQFSTTEGKKVFAATDPNYTQSVNALATIQKALAAAPKKTPEPRLVLPIGHLSAVDETRFSPNGKYILTSSDDFTLKLWDLTGKLLNTYEGHRSYISDITFNKDGSLIASGSSDSTARVWETVSGKLRHSFRGHTSAVQTVAFDNNTAQLLTTSRNNMVGIWNLNTGLNTEFIHFRQGLNAATYSPDSKGILFNTNENIIRFCNQLKDTVICKDFSGHDQTITGTKMIADMTRLVTASIDSNLIIWDVAQAQIIKKINVGFPIGKIAITSDESKILINAANAPYLELRLMDDLKPYLNWGENKTGYNNKISAAFSGDARYLFVTMSHSKGGLVYSLKDSVAFYKEVATEKTNTISDLNFSHDGNQVIISTVSSESDVWNPLTNKRITTLKGHTHHTNYLTTFFNDNYSLVGSYTNKAEVWNNLTMQPIFSLNSQLKNISGIYMSPSNEVFATSDWENKLQIWDSKTGKLLNEIPAGIEQVGSGVIQPLWAEDSDPAAPPSLNSSFKAKHSFETGVFSPDEKLIATASPHEDGIAIWDLANKKLQVSFNIGAAGVYSTTFSPDGKQLAAVGRSGGAAILNLQQRQLLQLKGHRSNVHHILYNKAGTKILTVSTDSTIGIWNAMNGQLMRSIDVGIRATFVSFSKDEKKILVIGSNTFKGYDATSFQQLFEVNSNATTITLMKDPNLVLLWGEYAKGAPAIFNITTYKIAKQFPAEMQGIIALSSDNLIITSSANNKNIRWNAVTGKPIVTFFTVDSIDHFAQTPEKYYYSSANAAKLLHYVTPELKVISFEQLDVKYNRPDKVLEAIGSKDKELIKSYKKAYEKRVKKLGIDTLAFRAGNSVPVADFADRDRIGPVQDKAQLALRITAADNDYPLQQLNVWINENPIFGMRGISLKSGKRNVLDTTILVTLSDGDNRIETSVRNTNGIESYRIPLQVQYTPAQPAPDKRYFIGIGINNFQQAQYNLQWSVKDIRDQARALGKKFGTNISIDTLFDEQVTVKNILALKQKLASTSINDKVILAYSGHGLLSKDYDYFLSTYDVNFQEPKDNGLPYEVLEGLLDKIPARKKLMLIDACHSGEVDKEEMLRLQNAQTSLKANKVSGSKGITDIVMDGGKIGMKNSFELMQQLFVNVGRSTGATIISAAGGMQYALETSKLKNGVFSYSILEFMEKHPTARVSEIKTYVNKRVTELTSGMQVPTTRSEVSAIDWEVW